MREANATLEAARDAEAGARADDLFHQRLTEGCGNQRLLDVVRPLRQALMAYERVYFSTRGAAGALGRAARGDHRRAGARASRREAAALVRDNFTTALPELTAELDARSRER